MQMNIEAQKSIMQTLMEILRNKLDASGRGSRTLLASKVNLPSNRIAYLTTKASPYSDVKYSPRMHNLLKLANEAGVVVLLKSDKKSFTLSTGLTELRVEVQRLIQESEMTQTHIAKLSGVTVSEVNRLYHGNDEMYTIGVFRLIKIYNTLAEDSEFLILT